jgi:hypothetical protein
MTTEPGEAADPVAAALSTIVRGLGELAQVHPWQVPDDRLGRTLADLDHVARLAEAQALRFVAEAGSRGLPGQGGHGRLSQWVREQLPTTSPRAAAAVARRAEQLFTRPVAVELAATREALLGATIRPEQADVVADAVEALVPPSSPTGVVDVETLAQAQTFLLAEAASFDAPRLRKLATYLRCRLDPDADDRLARDERARDRARCLTVSSGSSGMVHLSGSLTPECGAALTTAIDAWSAPAPAADGSPDPRTPAQRRHDGLQQLAQSAICDPGLLSTTHGSPYRIVVRTPFETLSAALDASLASTGLQPAVLPDGTVLSTSALAELACDAEIVPVLVDDLGHPLDVGDTQYSFPPKQRAAIIERDRHCTYPGCDLPPAWCQCHHIVWASRGGPTSVRNGALLCGQHHRYVHRLDLAGRVVDGQVVWDTGGPAPGGLDPGPGATRAARALDHLVRRWLTRRRQ